MEEIGTWQGKIETNQDLNLIRQTPDPEANVQHLGLMMEPSELQRSFGKASTLSYRKDTIHSLLSYL